MSTENNKPVVLVCLNKTADRNMVCEFLSGDYRVISYSDSGSFSHDFDLLIIDYAMFHEHEELLRQYKEDRSPVFVPFLLLAGNNIWSRKGDPIWETMDDVVPTPIPQHILTMRIDNLLETRQYSLDLKGKNEQLSIFEQAINSTNTGVLITDYNRQDNPIIFANDGFEKMTGYRKDEILGRNCRFLQDDDRGQDGILRVRSLTKDEKEGEVLLRNYRKDGTLFWNKLLVAPIKNDEGDTTHFVGIQNDVTELIEAQEKLREEKEKYRLITENAADMVVRNTPDGIFTYVSPSSEKLTGYTPEELIGRSFYEFFHDDDLDRLKETHEKFMNRPGTFKVEYRFKTKGGEYLWVESSIQAIQDEESGEVTEVQGAVRDISERKAYEQQLQQEKEFIHSIIDNMPGVFYMLDKDAKPVLWNRNLVDTLGYSDEEIAEMNALDFVESEDVEIARQDILKKFETGSGESIVDLVGKDGKATPYHLQGFRIKKDDDVFIIGSGVDISNEVKALEQLEERVKEQTCLYKIARLNGHPETLEELFQPAVEFIPEGWQYPEITAASISYDGRTYISPDYRDTDWVMVNEKVNVLGKPLQIKVVYHEDKPLEDEGVFLKEERQLIETITELLASQIERIVSRSKLRDSERRWERLVQNDPNLIQISVDGEIKFINPAGALVYGAESPDELIGKNYYELLQFEELELAKSRAQKALQGERTEPYVHKVTVPGGKVRYIEAQSMPISYEGHDDAIQVVGKDVTDLILYQQELKESLQEKEILLQEIHHRVKNNLAVVSGLLELQRFETEDENVQKILSNSEMRIRSMALVHEKLYEAQSLSEIDLNQYVKDLVETTQLTIQSGTEVDIGVVCDAITLNVNQAVPFALIISELIANAFEHAFIGRKEGRISIKIHERDGRVLTRVEDDGVGLPADFNIEEEQSMGFTIIKTLLKQLDSKLQIDGEAGTTVSFDFEKRQIKGSASTLI